MKSNICNHCGSRELYTHRPVSLIGGSGPNLMPGLNKSIFSSPKATPVLCSKCGLLQFFADESAKKRVIEHHEWHRLT